MSGLPQAQHVAPEGSTGGSEEPQGPKSESLLSMQLTRNKTKKVTINWFSAGDSGTKMSYDLEITDSNLVSDVIGFSAQHFSQESGTTLQPEDYVLRPAKRDGKPKTEYPVLDSAQAVYSSGFVSLTLCPASLKAKDVWVPATLPEEDEKSSQVSMESKESKESKDFIRPKPERVSETQLPPAPAGQGCCSCVCF